MYLAGEREWEQKFWILANFPCKSSLVAVKYKHRKWPAIPAIGCGKQEVGYVQK